MADGETRVVLDNGFTVFVRENPVAPVVAVALLARMGTRWETAQNAGISNFVHVMMGTGTTRRGGGEIAEAVAGLGGKISLSGDTDYSGIQGVALARFWRDLLTIVAEIALTPELAADKIDRERDWVLSRVQRRRDNAPSRAFDEFYGLLYGTHPYSIPTLGTPAGLKAADHAAVVAAYRAFYRPERLTLAVSGDVRAAEVVAEARRLFGGMPPGGAGTDPSVPPPRPPSRRLVIEQPAQQTQILVGGLAPAMSHADHAAAKVLSTLLGGGMAGRLFVELRDKRALAYTATAFYDPVHEPGALVLYLGTLPENAERAEQALLDEVRRVQREAIPPAELERAKNYLLGKYVMDRRTNERLAWYLAFYSVQGAGTDFPERYRRAAQAVTAADVQRMATTCLGAPATVVLGPRKPA